MQNVEKLSNRAEHHRKKASPSLASADAQYSHAIPLPFPQARASPPAGRHPLSELGMWGAAGDVWGHSSKPSGIHPCIFPHITRSMPFMPAEKLLDANFRMPDALLASKKRQGFTPCRLFPLGITSQRLPFSVSAKMMLSISRGVTT